MKHVLFVTISVLLFSCNPKNQEKIRNFNKVEVENILQDSLLSIRAIEILNNKNVAFAANNSAYGFYNPKTKMWDIAIQKYNSLNLHFRAIAHTNKDFFMITIENPALLFKSTDTENMELVYKEESIGVFYDAMTFWNDNEGIAVGDSMNGCLSIIITRDGGQTWKKIACENLPKSETNENAFAASNTNIKTIGNKTWIATSSGNVYYSKNKGGTWQVVKTPIIQNKETEGIYSIDFYDENNGFAIGGDYTKPKKNSSNKIKTTDGGKTWSLVAENETPNFRSCVQYIPNKKGKELVAIGFNGIDFSNNAGESWKHISDESFYTIRFLNDSTAYASGAGRISKLTFKE